jgi:hypothetical protein
MSKHRITHYDAQIQRYYRAGSLATIAMGKDVHGNWIAEEDPLAWWCLTDAIANFARNIQLENLIKNELNPDEEPNA